MKLTTKSEYAILGLIYLADNYDTGFVKIQAICGKYNISKKYLEMIFTTLRQNHYIKTKRGSAGGYALAKKPGKINIAEIIRLMDGALAPTESVSKYFFADTPIRQNKKTTAVFRDIRDYIAKKLETITFQDLI